MTEPSMTKLTHLRQLDGLRFLAAGAVMAQHWVTNQLDINAPLGYSGVTLFFVLSGFLITCILLGSKDTHIERGLPGGSYFKRFYIRRVLRIFPLYIAVVTVLWLFDAGTVREDIGWFLTHTINIKFFLQRSYDPWVGHLWTLAIEEQFYLVYPLIIYLTPRRWLVKMMFGLIALSLASKASLLGAGYSYRAINFFPVGCFDAFGLGGLMGFMYTYRNERLRAIIESRGALIALLSVVALAVPVRLFIGEGGSYQAVWFRLLISSLSAWIITRAIFGFTGITGRFLEHPWVSYLGKISYGLYVYHYFMAHIAEHFVGRELAAEFYLAPLYFAATVAISALSWEVFESPMNGMKDRVAAYLQ